MAAEKQYKLKIKVNNNDDTRLWRYTSIDDFNGLCTFITTTWENHDFIAQYEDEEGDLITIASAQDLKDAVDFARSENKKSLKIFVVSNISQKRAPKQAVDEGLNDEPVQPKKQFNSTREMVFDFLTNKQIITLLPEFFGTFISKLVEKGSNLKVNEITNLIYAELKDERFMVITSHPLYNKYAALVIPYIANRVYHQQSLYPHFRSNTIKNWIRQLIQMLYEVLQQNEATMGCSFKDIVIDIQYPSMTDTGKVIHFGVECDLCGQYPIIGDRYKCSICEDWDCCSQCEPKHDHPLIKFKKASKNHKNASFKGLTEIVQRLSGSPQMEQKVDIDLDLVCDCICGAKMNPVQAKKAYKNCITVYCDICNARFFNEMVYHCPNGYDAVHHKNGYDLCPSCADKKVIADKEKELQQNGEAEQEQQQEQQEEEEEKEKVEAENENENENEIQDEIQIEVEPEAPAQPEPEPEVEAEIDIENEAEVEAFEYAKQLQQIKEIMAIQGTDTDDAIKALLVTHKGDISRVVPLLLQ